MNPEIKKLFADFLAMTDDEAAAASLVVADVLIRQEKEPTVVEPGTLTVQETAARMKISTRKVYEMCATGEMPCIRVGRMVRIPMDVIERFEAKSQPIRPAPRDFGFDHLAKRRR